MRLQIKIFSFSVVLMLTLVLLQVTAVASVTTGTWYMDQSNAFADGVNYGQVDISANDSTGVVSFTVDAFIVPAYGTPPFTNFGIQSFGFNYANITSTPAGWTINLPGSWSASSGNEDGFGSFGVTADGSGSSRQDPLVFDITLPTVSEAIANNFAVLSTGTAGQGNVFFAAHVAGFNGIGAESHYIGGSSTTVIPAPGAIVLGGIGVCLVGWLKRRRMV